MEELTNCPQKELENLENKLENAIQVDREEAEKRIITENEKLIDDIRKQREKGDRREILIQSPVDREEVEKRITENEKLIDDIRKQREKGDRREILIQSPGDIKIQFGGDVKKLHPVIFINNLKKKVRYIGNFETPKETIRNHLIDEASLWSDSKEEELDNWHKFEQKFLRYFWGKMQQMEINKDLQNGRYHDRMGISEQTYALQLYNNAKQLHYNYSSEQIVELIARHFEDTLEDHITLQNYKDIDRNYRQRENQDYRDRRQKFRRYYKRREFIPRSENENRVNGRRNYEQRNRQWNEDRYRENQNRNNTRTYQEDRNDNRRNKQENRGNRYGPNRPRENRRAVNNTQIGEYEDEGQSDEGRSEEE
uniref:Myb-like protein Z n=1 Tax=Diabrotica virgifera virgifera TaxID=50390 RepID=A0A6P7GXM7_DIAVI